MAATTATSSPICSDMTHNALDQSANIEHRELYQDRRLIISTVGSVTLRSASIGV